MQKLDKLGTLDKPIQLFYFGELGDRLGLGQEELPLPEHCTSVRALLQHLAARGSAWQSALAQGQRLSFAVNQCLARLDSEVRAGNEVAIFSPVTGG